MVQESINEYGNHTINEVPGSKGVTTPYMRVIRPECNHEFQYLTTDWRYFTTDTLFCYECYWDMPIVLGEVIDNVCNEYQYPRMVTRRRRKAYWDVPRQRKNPANSSWLLFAVVMVLIALCIVVWIQM